MVHSSALVQREFHKRIGQIFHTMLPVSAIGVANAAVVLPDVVALPITLLPSELAHQQIDHLADRLHTRDTPLSHSR